MACYKVVDLNPRFLAVNLEKQLLPSGFVHAVRHLVDMILIFRSLIPATVTTTPAPWPTHGMLLKIVKCEPGSFSLCKA